MGFVKLSNSKSPASQNCSKKTSTQIPRPTFQPSQQRSGGWRKKTLIQ